LALKLLVEVEVQDQTSALVKFARSQSPGGDAWKALFDALPQQNFAARLREQALCAELAKWLDRYAETIYQDDLQVKTSGKSK
jgi:hypothetical protein